MLISRKNDRASAESNRKVSSLPAYIRRIIDVYSAMEIDRTLWLTDREKDFYVATVVHVVNGITNPISDEALQIYKELFFFQTNKRKIADYINRISKKKWAIYDKKKRHVRVVPIFDNISIDGDLFDFNFRLFYEADRSDTDGAS